MNNLFLTGQIGIGKSTLLQNVLKELNLSIGGYTTQRVFEGYYRKYIVKFLYDMEEFTILKVDSRDNSKQIYPLIFERDLISVLDKSLKHKDLIVLDELGCTEDSLEVFKSQVFKLLDSPKIVFGVLKDDDCGFLNDIRNRNDVTIIRVTEDNRDYICKDLVDMLRSLML